MRRLHSLLLLPFLSILLSQCTPRVDGAEKPNIVWLISEDNSTHYMNLYDPHGTETPRIAELAEHGLQFQNAFSNAPVCSVARTTLMTSCYGPRIGTQFHRRSVEVPMPEGVKMFPAYLRESGYYTTNNKKKDYNATETPGTWDESSGSASWRNREAGQPFFHMQSFTTTHESSLHFDQTTYENQPTQTDPETVFVQPYFPQTDLFKYTVAKYHDNIRKMDTQIGRVIDQLHEDDLLDDTFIFYFGDHGGVLPRGKGYAYESGLHVPFVVYVPKNFRHLVDRDLGSQVQGFVEFIDFGVTTLRLAGVAGSEKVDGRAFLGEGVTAQAVDERNEAFGYADRFDEKYDLVRTLRKGKYEYVRNYQPLNFDGLQNNYRYIMLAYRQWRQLYDDGKLNATQSQFFERRPAEQLFNVEVDPHEIHNLAEDPAYAAVLADMRERLAEKVKSLPDLSFYPESYLVDNVFDRPTEFGQTHVDEIARLVDIADLAIGDFSRHREQIEASINSDSELDRYWAILAAGAHGKKALALKSAIENCLDDEDCLVRVRAAEFLGVYGELDPRPVIMQCLKETQSGVRANLILNSAVLLNDGHPGYDFEITEADVHPDVLSFQDVRRRLAYFAAEDGVPSNPQGLKKPKSKK